MSSFIEGTNKRIDDIVKKHSEDIPYLRRSVEFAHNSIKDLKKNEVENRKLKHTANELKQNLNACEESLILILMILINLMHSIFLGYSRYEMSILYIWI